MAGKAFPGPRCRATPNDLALAYELKCEGFSLKHIAAELNLTEVGLRDSLKRCERFGLMNTRKPHEY